ncbi:MAG: hypothetical protein FGM58_05510, partial [Acidimicrobiia bacterium]|nr:hypothetical protein [Acidimicrobiia bacterium]
MRVAHLTSVDPDVVAHDLDRPFLEAAFAERGIELVACGWEDDGVDWDEFDLVLVRSPWNYVENESAMRRFLVRFEGSSRFHNPVGVVEWNLDKRYLRDLAALGVPVVPTAHVDSRAGLDDALSAVTAAEVVVK